MAAAEPLPSEDDDPSSLTKCHEALAGGSNGQEPSESWGEGDPELSAREQSCLRRLHAWGEQNSGSRLREPRGEESNSIPWSAFRPGTARGAVGRFEVVRELGRGGFGIVFLAFDPLLCREVALKLPAPQVVVTPGLCDRFLREARAAAGLSHPNLVNVYETGAWGVAAYIAIEYCPGETLAAWLQNRAEPVPVTSAATLVATLARALDYAHNQGVIHRDLKPSNIVLVANPGSSSAPSGAVDLGGARSQNHGFRAREADRERPRRDAQHCDFGNPDLHGAGAGRVAAGRYRAAYRCLRAGRDPVRDADGPGPFFRRDRDGNAEATHAG